MPVAFTTYSAVIAECSHCGERSEPMDPDQIEAWQQDHEDLHAREALRERMAGQGHATISIVEWMDRDDSSAHVECSCGWGSRSSKKCYMGDYIDAHLKEVEPRTKAAAQA